MSIIKAMEAYFEKQGKYWQSRYSTYPKAPYSDTIDKRMLIPNSLENGYIQWQPLRQELDIYGGWLYTIEGDRIIDKNGNWKYTLRGDYLMDTYGNRVKDLSKPL